MAKNVHLQNEQSTEHKSFPRGKGKLYNAILCMNLFLSVYSDDEGIPDAKAKQ